MEPKVDLIDINISKLDTISKNLVKSAEMIKLGTDKIVQDNDGKLQGRANEMYIEQTKILTNQLKEVELQLRNISEMTVQIVENYKKFDFDSAKEIENSVSK